VVRESGYVVHAIFLPDHRAGQRIKWSRNGMVTENNSPSSEYFSVSMLRYVHHCVLSIVRLKNSSTVVLKERRESAWNTIAM
jgi:hypothetical protein